MGPTVRCHIRVRGARISALLLLISAVISCSVSHASDSQPSRTAPVSGDGTTSTVGATSTSAVRPPAPQPAPVVVSTVGTLPSAVSGAVAAPVSGGVLLAGGLDASDRSTDTIVFWRIDGQTTVVGHTSTPFHDAAAVASEGALLAFGGGHAGSTLAEVRRISTDGTVVPLGRMPAARSDLSAARVGDKTYIVGGFDGSASTPDVLVTRGGASFAVVATLPHQVRYGALVATAGRLLMIGGEAASGPSDDVIQIDPSAHTARVVSHLPFALSHAAAFLMAGQVFVAGGRSDRVAHDEVWRLDPTTGSLIAVSTLPQPVTDAAVAVVGSTAYLFGGTGASTLDSVVAIHQE